MSGAGDAVDADDVEKALDEIVWGTPLRPPSLFDENYDDELDAEPTEEELAITFGHLSGAATRLRDAHRRRELRRTQRPWRPVSRNPLESRVFSAAERAPGPERFTVEDWLRAVRVFRSSCAYCGKKGAALTLLIEHVLPVCRGGVTDPWNIVPSCRGCNARKGAKTPDEWLSGEALELFYSRCSAAFKRYERCAR